MEQQVQMTFEEKLQKLAELAKIKKNVLENREILDTLTDVLMKENHIDGNRMKQIFENAR